VNCRVDTAAHAARVREHELHIHPNDTAEVREAKLTENEQYMDARMDALSERINALERQNPSACAAASAVLDEWEARP
jgi:hypothetical protein